MCVCFMWRTMATPHAIQVSVYFYFVFFFFLTSFRRNQDRIIKNKREKELHSTFLNRTMIEVEKKSHSKHQMNVRWVDAIHSNIV